MAATSIPLIATSEYEAFRDLCDKHEVQTDYRALLELVEQRKRNFRAQGKRFHEVMDDTARIWAAPT
jgi:hypothetical protein